jgi:nucleoid-associated protein YejK
MTFPLSKSALLEIAETVADEILAAQDSADFDAFSRNFTDDLREKLTPDLFAETCNRLLRDYGKYASRSLLCVLSNPHCIPVIWKLRFEKADQDFLLQIRFVEVSGPLRVESVLLRGWML